MGVSPKPPRFPSPEPCRSYRHHKFTRREKRKTVGAYSWVDAGLRTFDFDICRYCGWMRCDLEKLQLRKHPCV